MKLLSCVRIDYSIHYNKQRVLHALVLLLHFAYAPQEIQKQDMAKQCKIVYAIHHLLKYDGGATLNVYILNNVVSLTFMNN